MRDPAVVTTLYELRHSRCHLLIVYKHDPMQSGILSCPHCRAKYPSSEFTVVRQHSWRDIPHLDMPDMGLVVGTPKTAEHKSTPTADVVLYGVLYGIGLAILHELVHHDVLSLSMVWKILTADL